MALSTVRGTHNPTLYTDPTRDLAHGLAPYHSSGLQCSKLEHRCSAQTSEGELPGRCGPWALCHELEKQPQECEWGDGLLIDSCFVADVSEDECSSLKKGPGCTGRRAKTSG